MSADAIARKLAPVLGDERALAAVYEAVHEVGYVGKVFNRWEQAAILEWLAEQPGLVGTAARRAQHAMGFGGAPAVRAPASPRTSQRRISTPPPGPHMVEGSELMAMFARALGDE